ncbi:hypothetical protein D9611_011013 [Ephemerocybe angulata]|uniref:BBC1/AIM3 cysteine proteinase-fold domain-containing protein n=1 Tax=Ephemerocybe angulata TaxID=980116 RepID=A0A8H5BBB3_9AGAR|nr:hypothetical protein D9611_011013 [Tulosesus angulatus]
MSDQPEAPPKKIGSLRDRIAAFEKAGAGSAAPAAAPAPRPKPAGFASWKPRPPSPSSPATAEPTQESSSKASAGLSASDAKESIVRGGSLKDRMAALQGKGAFGAPPPVAPKPALEKPKWKPPPVVAAPEDDDDAEPRQQPNLGDIIKSPPTAKSPEPGEEKEAVEGEGAAPAETEGEEGAVDPEEEERQRRAAIAARMARLGGARVGMAPVFGKRPPPPPKKRSSVSEDVAAADVSKDSVTSPKVQSTEPEALVASPPSASIDENLQRPESTRRLSEAGSLASIDSTESQASRTPPVSMPVPAAPRRAAPPRKKPAKPTAPPPPVPEAEVEDADAAAPTTAEELPSEPAPNDKADVAPPTEALVTPLPPTPAAEVVEATLEDEEESSGLSPDSDPVKDEPASLETPVGPRAHSPEEVLQEGETKNDDPEPEIDEDTRRRQVAERIAKMGGINPFAVPVPSPRQSSKVSEEATPSVPVEEPVESPSLQPTNSKDPETPLAEVKQPPEAAHHASDADVTASQWPDEDSQDSSADKGSIEEEEEPLAAATPLKQEITTSHPVSDSNVPQKEAEIKESEENDDDSEYSDDEDGSQLNNQASVDLRADDSHSSRPESQAYEAPPPPPPRVHHSPEVPHRGVPPPPPETAEEEEEEDYEDEDNDEMSRSQILVPPPGHSHTHTAPDEVEESEKEAQEPADPQAEGSQGSLSEYEDENEPPAVLSPLVSPRAPSFPPAPPTRPSQPPPVTRSLPPPPSHSPPASQGSLKVPRTAEILDEDEGDPIDPSFHTPSRRASAILPATTPPVLGTPSSEIPPPQEPSEPQEDSEALRRRTIAERMAKLGGIKFGAAPPVPSYRNKQPAPSQETQEESENAGQAPLEEPKEANEEDEERARKERIAAKLANMGGMRIGMMPTAFPPRKSQALTEQAPTSPPPPPPPARARPPPPPQTQETESEHEGSTASEDLVKVEAEESDLEEVRHDEVEEAAPPPPPSRAARPARRESADLASSPPIPSSPPRRPPVPTGLPVRRPSTQTVSSQRRTSGDSAVSPPPAQRKPSMPKQQPSEYVMVEEPQDIGGQDDEAPPPLPPPRLVPKRTSVSASAKSQPLEAQDSLSSHWELPNIPTSSLEFGSEDLSMSWTEAEAPQEDNQITPSVSSLHRVQSPPHPPAVQPARSANDVDLSSDDLISLWGRVGVQVCEAATNLFERSKKGLIGDGTYPGFIRAVIREVPNAVLTDDLGYVIYKQQGGSVQKRASDIMPGDLVALHDAKFKGHKGLQAYHQNVGADEPVLGVVSEFEPKKSKIRLFQANQHVGQQTVESVSYRLEDLKSGSIIVYRVVEA